MAEIGRILRDKLGLMTQGELAVMLEVTEDTLREWRRLKQGPDFVKAGKTVMYRAVDVQDWIKRNVVPIVGVILAAAVSVTYRDRFCTLLGCLFDGC